MDCLCALTPYMHYQGNKARYIACVHSIKDGIYKLLKDAPIHHAVKRCGGGRQSARRWALYVDERRANARRTQYSLLGGKVSRQRKNQRREKGSERRGEMVGVKNRPIEPIKGYVKREN